MQNKLNIQETFTEAFNLGVKNMVNLLLTALLYFVTIWIPYLNVGTTIGFYKVIVALSKGEEIVPTSIFSRENYKGHGDFFLLFGLESAGLGAALVFFCDEAHMLFKDTSKALIDKIEQVIRLVRSKGVGVYFVTQSPSDIPEVIAGQLGNRVLHGLRAYTPKDQKTVKAAAQTFRANPSFNTEAAILELGTGEALVSFLDEKGAPCVVERAKILFPLSQIGAITEGQRTALIRNSRLYGIYDKSFDRESAYELLIEQQKQEEKRRQREEEEEEKRLAKEAKEKERSRSTSSRSTSSKKKSTTRKAVEKTINTTATTFGRQLGKSIFRGLLGGIFKK